MRSRSLWIFLCVQNQYPPRLRFLRLKVRLKVVFPHAPALATLAQIIQCMNNTHNSTTGGKINTIQTWQKILTPCIHLGRPFAGPGSREPAAPRPWACKRPPSMDTACRISHPVSIVYVFVMCSIGWFILNSTGQCHRA